MWQGFKRICAKLVLSFVFMGVITTCLKGADMYPKEGMFSGGATLILNILWVVLVVVGSSTIYEVVVEKYFPEFRDY